MKKRLLTLILAALMMIVLSACGSKDKGDEPAGTDPKGAETAEDNSLQYIKDNKKLILGFDDSFLPMGFRDDANNIIGFDIDLAKAVVEKLGVELVLQPIEWDAKEQELSTKSIDCIWNGFSITDERLAKLTMSIPYMENSIAFVVTKDSTVADKADLSGMRLAVQSGSSAEEALDSADNKEFKDTLGEVNGFADYETALLDLETGNSDAVLMDSVMANYMINEIGKDYVILDDNLVAEEYAVGFRKGDDALCDAVSEAFRELKEDGTVGQISTKWFGSDITIIK